MRTRAGAWSGTLYVRGGRDPTFGSAAFDRSAYGTGATVERLVGRLQSRFKLTAVTGRIIGDESAFDSLRGTIQSGFAFVPFMEGSLSAMAFNRSERADGTAVASPPRFAARQLAAALQGPDFATAQTLLRWTLEGVRREALRGRECQGGGRSSPRLSLTGAPAGTARCHAGNV